MGRRRFVSLLLDWRLELLSNIQDIRFRSFDFFSSSASPNTEVDEMDPCNNWSPSPESHCTTDIGNKVLQSHGWGLLNVRILDIREVHIGDNKRYWPIHNWTHLSASPTTSGVATDRYMFPTNFFTYIVQRFNANVFQKRDPLLLAHPGICKSVDSLRSHPWWICC